MNLRQHVKFLTLISLISITTILTVTFFTSNLSLSVAISLVADIIQILTYVVWFLQKEVNLEKVPEQMEEVHAFITIEREESRVAGEIMSRLVREGVVREDELFRLIRRKEIILAYPYGEGISSRKVWNLVKGQPLARLLSKMGFARVGSRQNLMVIMADTLPKRLRNVDKLNAYLKKHLPKEWKRISEKVSEKYPEERYKILEKWRTRAGFKVSYILAKSMAQDFLINYLGKTSFTPEFQKHIAGRIDRNQLKKIIRLNRRKVREIVSKISIEFLLKDIPRNARKVIINNEDDVKKALGVEVVTDYRLLEPEIVAGVLANLLPRTEEKTIYTYSTEIIGQSQACYEALRKFGIDLIEVMNGE